MTASAPSVTLPHLHRRAIERSDDYRQFGGGLFPKTCFRLVHRSNSLAERSRAPMVLDFVDNRTHSSYMAHSSADAAGSLGREFFMTLPPSPEVDDFELNSGASGIVLKLSWPDSCIGVQPALGTSVYTSPGHTYITAAMTIMSSMGVLRYRNCAITLAWVFRSGKQIDIPATRGSHPECRK